ncbi:unnamed protein product [Chironomus riparius]|uniref:Chitin-binding type-2 domain-containing protein n=1 Tax=Chironomus riparius TaxID=315576 RepID=A0A9N9WUA9_9DIPT|nr:unnamed protein product [Chironomus riparius]
MMEKFLIFLIIFALDFHGGNSALLSVNGNDEVEEQMAVPYLWPNFPFFPGVNFPPSMPDWMIRDRTNIRPVLPTFPTLPELRWPPIQLPWPTPAPDDEDDEGDDDEEDIEECPEDGVKLISHPEECGKYILCMDGDEITTLVCPSDMHFSREMRVCMDPDDAECE